jgi:hypothetical protein
MDALLQTIISMAGQQAFEGGIARADNPYPADAEAQAAWDKGWLDGETEAAHRKDGKNEATPAPGPVKLRLIRGGK